MLNLFNLWEIEENKIIRFEILMLIIGCAFVGSVMIVMSFDAIKVYGDKYIGLIMLLIGMLISLSPSIKMFYKENSEYPNVIEHLKLIVRENVL